MGFYNLQLYQLTDEIRNLIIQKQLPIGMIYYMLQSLTAEIEQLYNQSIQQELELFQKNNKNISDALQEKINESPLHFEEIIEDKETNIKKFEEESSGQE